MRDIQIGDLVEIVNDGATYPGYADFFSEQEVPYLQDDWEKDNLPAKGQICCVEHIGRHRDYYSTLYIVRDSESVVYIIGEDGLEFYARDCADSKILPGDLLSVLEVI